MFQPRKTSKEEHRAHASSLPRTHLDLARGFRGVSAAYERGRDLLQIGAYVGGSDPALDQAIQLHGAMTQFLQQDMYVGASMADSVRAMQAALEGQAA